jgi:hypothetical protein
MTILSVGQRVCLAIGLDVPDALMSSTEREHQELVRLADEVATSTMETFDWQELQVIKTYTGDGASEAFDLPTDYHRMDGSAEMWSSRWTWPFNHVESANRWLEYLVVPFNLVNGNWIIYGGQFHFLPIMGPTETLKFFYISKNYVRQNGGGTLARFVADTDSFRLDERLLELGMIWQWRQRKGLPYAEDMAAFGMALTNAIKRNRGAEGVVSGNRPSWARNAKPAFGGNVGGGPAGSPPAGYKIFIGNSSILGSG